MHHYVLDLREFVFNGLMYLFCDIVAFAKRFAAVGAYLAFQQGKSVTVFLKQPGGILEVHAEPDGSVILSGSVKPVHRKTVTVDL